MSHSGISWLLYMGGKPDLRGFQNLGGLGVAHFPFFPIFDQHFLPTNF